MERSTTDKAVDSFVAELLTSPPATAKKSSKLEEIEKRKRALEALKAPKPTRGSSDISDSEKRLRELERETTMLSVTDSSSGSSSSSSSSSRSVKMEELLRRKAEAEAKLRSVTEGKHIIVPTSGTSSRIRGLEAEKSKLKYDLADLPSTKELLEARDTASNKLDRLQRGIDVCFLIDCTGSMEPFIKAAKDKILEIILKVENIENTAIMRVAFVGYRDYGDGDLQHEKVDFVEKADLGIIRAKLAACPATGGDDGPEDIPGGLKIVTELSWNSSTRLLIHFADYPCHGLKYHDSSMRDTYPDGDPKGLVPEDLLRMIMKKRIDYYFMKITNHTDIMMALFQSVFEQVGKEIFVNNISSNASDFVPKVMKSISSSMARSAAFKGVKITY